MIAFEIPSPPIGKVARARFGRDLGCTCSPKTASYESMVKLAAHRRWGRRADGVPGGAVADRAAPDPEELEQSAARTPRSPARSADDQAGCGQRGRLSRTPATAWCGSMTQVVELSVAQALQQHAGRDGRGEASMICAHCRRPFRPAAMVGKLAFGGVRATRSGCWRRHRCNAVRCAVSGGRRAPRLDLFAEDCDRWRTDVGARLTPCRADRRGRPAA